MLVLHDVYTGVGGIGNAVSSCRAKTGRKRLLFLESPK